MKFEILKPTRFAEAPARREQIRNPKPEIRKGILGFGFRYSNLFRISSLVLLVLVFSMQYVMAQPANPPPAAPASSATQNLQTPLPNEPSFNPNSSAFKIAVCDGPTLPKTEYGKEAAAEFQKINSRPYVPCDFNAVILLVRHLINIMMVLGVLIAIIMFSYAGVLYITGQKPYVDKAHKIFPKVFGGFIIMLSAWFIVYQILSWLTDNNGFKTLLGTP